VIVYATPKFDRVADITARRLRGNGPLAAIRGLERIRGLSPELRGEVLESISGIWVLKSRLHVAVYRGLTSEYGDPGSVENHGVVSRKLITNNGVAYLVDAWQNIVEMETMKYHGIGTGSTADNASDSALVTESTTALNPDSTRATGTTTESSAPVFVTVGTATVDATTAVAEHGIFSQAATGGGVLWDRSLTGTQNLSSGDSLQATYSMTASAGG
jgi:hypothetical protein